MSQVTDQLTLLVERTDDLLEAINVPKAVLDQRVIDATAAAVTAVDKAVLTALDAAATAQDRTASGLSAASALASKVATDRLYPGSFATDPLVRPDGSARQVGDEIFNSSVGLKKRWSGTAWVASDISTANLAASGGSSLVGYLPDGLGTVPNTVENKLRTLVDVLDFMSSAERNDVRSFVGAMNVTTAFQKAAAKIQSAGGGHLIIPAGKYKVGRQTFAGVGGLGYAYRAEKIIDIQGCTKPVLIECRGAQLKFADGLKFGSFDPVSGLPNAPALPNVNQNYAADVGLAMRFANNAGGVKIAGSLEIDGNNTMFQIGGQWGDVGYQRLSYGIHEYNNAYFYVENAYVHHHGTDGIVCGYTGAVAGGPSRPKMLINVISEYNARQGLSWVGGIGLTAINCKFNRSGRAINVGTGLPLVSAPAAGIDIEAEQAVNRNGVFINCEAINNNNTALVADSGDSADMQFIGCKFGGIIWPKKPGFSFHNCKIHGQLVNLYGHVDPTVANSFRGCLITDESLDDYVLAPILGQNLSSTVLSAPAYFDLCEFRATKCRPGRMDFFVLSNCRIDMTFAGTAAVNDTDYAVLLNGATLNNTKFDANITVNPPISGFSLGLPAETIGKNTLTNTAGIVRWGSWSTGAGGYVGDLGNMGNKRGTQALSIFPGNWSTQYYGTLDIYAMTAAPTTGTYKKGDCVLNQNPAVGGTTGWICTVAGTPGTWVATGIVSSARVLSQTDTVAADLAALKVDFNALLAKLRAAGLMAP